MANHPISSKIARSIPPKLQITDTPTLKFEISTTQLSFAQIYSVLLFDIARNKVKMLRDLIKRRNLCTDRCNYNIPSTPFFWTVESCIYRFNV